MATMRTVTMRIIRVGAVLAAWVPRVVGAAMKVPAVPGGVVTPAAMEAPGEGDNSRFRIPDSRQYNPKFHRNPKFKIQNPKSKIQNPKPETRNPKPETRNPKPETRPFPLPVLFLYTIGKKFLPIQTHMCPQSVYFITSRYC
jgi:hypothetical protein